MRSMRGNRRIQGLAITVVALFVVCLISFLVYSILRNGGDSTVTTEVATNTPQPPVEETSQAKASTPTATAVVNQTVQAETEATTEAKEEESTPTPPSSSSSNAGEFESGGSMTKTAIITTYELGQLLKNADFEAGFAENGVAIGWGGFQNDGIFALFSPETKPYLDSGDGGQRITLLQTSQQDRYAGIYQKVAVVANEKYTLSLRGQIRSPFGDITQSSYGYRMQYALDETGNTDWQAVPTEKWVELPWDEVPLYGADPTLFSYMTEFTATTPQLTLFVRGWNKWAVGGETQYTLDNFSLVGSIATIKTVVLAPSGEPASMTPNTTDKEEAPPPTGLPTTGQLNLTVTAKVWSGVIILMGLCIGLIYGLRQQRR